MMWKFEIPATPRTPAVTFDFAENQLKLAGEFYPEDVTEFYKPVFEALDTYLARLGKGQLPLRHRAHLPQFEQRQSHHDVDG